MYSVCNVQCIMYKCTMYNVQCTMYNVQCTMYSVQCTYNVCQASYIYRYAYRVPLPSCSHTQLYTERCTYNACLEKWERANYNDIVNDTLTEHRTHPGS